MTKDTGGPAFPHTVEYKGADSGGVVPHGGMSLRDYFAAKAMVALLAGNFPITKEIDAEQRIAVAAYQMADAILKARKA